MMGVRLGDKRQEKIIEAMFHISWRLGVVAQDMVNRGMTADQMTDDIKARFGIGKDNRFRPDAVASLRDSRDLKFSK